MKLPVRIKGYAGEHDEAGAIIVDANDRLICVTARVRNTYDPSSWHEYFSDAAAIVLGLNSNPLERGKNG